MMKAIIAPGSQGEKKKSFKVTDTQNRLRGARFAKFCYFSEYVEYLFEVRSLRGR